MAKISNCFYKTTSSTFKVLKIAQFSSNVIKQRSSVSLFNGINPQLPKHFFFCGRRDDKNVVSLQRLDLQTILTMNMMQYTVLVHKELFINTLSGVKSDLLFYSNKLKLVRHHFNHRKIYNMLYLSIFYSRLD